MKVDYHMHTNCSDGVLPVEQVIARALSESIEALAVTDHDTVAGVAGARALCHGKAGFRSGLEHTVRERQFKAYGQPISIHLLGYDIREDDEALTECLKARARRVRTCFDRLCEKLSLLGMPVVYDEIWPSCGVVMQLCDVEAYIAGTYPLHPEFSKALDIIRGYAAKLTLVNLPLDEAVRLTHNAGGVAVWAHPFCVYGNFQRLGLSKEQVSGIMEELASLGIDGIEADYLAFDGEERLWLRREAKKKQLFCTGGSDFHGSKTRNRMGIEVSDNLFYE